jgi:signal transduction histidine kinase
MDRQTGHAIAQALEEQRMENERTVNKIRWCYLLYITAVVALGWKAQTEASSLMFAAIATGFGLYTGYVEWVLKDCQRYRPWHKYFFVGMDLICSYLTTVAELFNHSGFYETYRSADSWMIIAVANALSSLRYDVLTSLFGGVLTLLLGLLELGFVAAFYHPPWTAQSRWVGEGLNLIDCVRMIGFASLPALFSVVYAGYSRKMLERWTVDALRQGRLREAQSGMELELGRLRELAQSKERFLQIAAHELRSPITALRATAQLASHDPTFAGDAERVRRTFQRVDRQSLRLSALVSQLLDSALLGSRDLPLQRVACDLTQLCQTVVNDLSPAERSRVELEVAGPVVGHWDAARLEQVVINLLTNALRYSHAPSVVRLIVRMNADVARLEVVDQGIGIPETQLAHIFSPFFRATNAHTHHMGGLGLGMHIAKEIVTRHGGRIRVRSVERQGTTFVVELPAEPSQVLPPSGEYALAAPRRPQTEA